jgi:hypothetical protein
LEGIYLLKRAFQNYYDLSFWIDCSFETALDRAIVRGQEGLSREKALKAYRTIYFPADQGPRQKGPNTGKAENGVVRRIEDGKTYSKAADVMRVTIKPAQ